MKPRRSSGWSLLVAALLVAAPVRAEKSPTDIEAAKHYEEAMKAYSLGEFSRAVTEFKSAYNLKPDPAFLYNIAQAYRLANDLPQALFFYRSFLRSMPRARNRAEIEGRIHAIETQMEREKALTTAAPTTIVAPSGTQSPSEMGSAVHVEPPAPAPVRNEPTAAPVERPHVTAAPAKTPEVPAAVVAMPSEPAPPVNAPTPIYKKWWLWTVVGVVVVGAAVGLGVGLSRGDSAPSADYTRSASF